MNLRTFYLFIFSLALILSGIVSVQLGKSAGFDFLLYHYYNAFAFLHNREKFDVLAAGYRSFWNPLVELPFYACVTALPARACGFTAGAVHGLNYIAAAVLAGFLLAAQDQRTPLSTPLPWLLATAGALGAASLGMLGGVNNDNFVSCFFLVSLFWVCREAERTQARFRPSAAWLLAAGISVGLGCGLKLTLVPFGIAIVCAPVFYSARWLYRLLWVGFCGLGVAIGVLITSGLLMLRMFRTFGNPMFPYFSAYFDSPFRDFLDARDLRYLPGNLVEAFFYPLVFALDPQRVSEFAFRDFRLPAVFVLVLICAVAWVFRRARNLVRGSRIRRLPTMPPRVRVFLAVLSIAYVVWMAQASVYRYAYPLELLSFVVMALLLRNLLLRRGQLVALTLLAGIILPTTSPLATRRLAWDGKDFVAVKLPSAPTLQAGAIVLLAGKDAMTYAIPSFPPDIRFLGVDVMERTAFATGENSGLSTPATEADMGPLAADLHALIAAHHGQVLGMFNGSSRERAAAAFARYGFGYDPAHCGRVTSNVAANNPLLLCELAPM